MGNKFLAISFAILVVFLTGCASTGSHLVSRKEALIDKGHGLVVVSLGSTTMMNPSIDVVATRLDGAPTDLKINSDGFWVGDAWKSKEAVRSSSSGGRRLLLAYSVLPGSYSIDAVKLYIPSGTVNYSGEVKLQRPYKFEIEAGKLTYLGVVEVDMVTGPNVIGEIIPILSMKVPSRMSVRVLDEFEDDNKVLISMRPELSSAPVLRPGRR